MRSSVGSGAAERGRKGVAVQLRSGQSLLEQPGILASMVLPSPDSESAREPRPGHSASTPAWRVRVAALAAGAAVAAGVLDLGAWLRERRGLHVLPTGDWWLAAGCVALLAWLVRSGSAGRSRALWAAFAGFAAAGAAALAAGGLGNGLPTLLVRVAPLGGLIGLLRPGRVRVDAALAVGAALATAFGCGELIRGAVASEELAAAGHLLAATIVLVGIVAVASVSPTSRRAAAAGNRWAMLTQIAAMAWALLLVPPGLGLGKEALAASASFVALLALILVGASARAPGLAFGAATAGALLLPRLAPPSAVVGDDVTVLGEAGDCVAVYCRGNQELRLYERGTCLDAQGPDRAEAPLVVALLQALLRPGDRVHVLGAGIGGAIERLRGLGGFALEVCDARPQVAPLRARLLADGPVAPADAERALPLGAPTAVAGVENTLRALQVASRQALLFATPLAPGATAQLDAGLQGLARRAVGDGLVVQVVALDRTPPSVLAACFAAACAAHPWNGVFVVGDALALVSAGQAPDWSTPSPFAAWSTAARWSLYESHVGDVADLRRSQRGVLRMPATSDLAAGDEPPGLAVGRSQALRVLAAWCIPIEVPAVPDSGSVFERWSAAQATLRATVDRLAALADDATGRHTAVGVAAQWLPCGAPAAALQAALGLAGDDGPPLSPPELACLAAQAIDPTFFAHAPPVFGSLPRPLSIVAKGELEDLARLPADDRLAEICVGTRPRAIALRARFAARCARALVGRLAAGPLDYEAAQALRELADPFVLAEAGRVLEARGAGRELLGLWRGDLPMPSVLGRLLVGSAEDRAALAAALGGRRDPSIYGVLAELLVAEETPLRRAAAAVLRQAVGDRVAYDPEWPAAARNAAARQLRALHNRAP